MRIGNSLPLLPTSVSDRGYGTARGSRSTDVVESTGDSTARGEVTRVRSRSTAANATASSFSDRNLSQRSRDALQSYLANGPTLTERLGVELAGIDVQV